MGYDLYIYIFVLGVKMIKLEGLDDPSQNIRLLILYKMLLA